jgi:hypothetical protein
MYFIVSPKVSFTVKSPSALPYKPPQMTVSVNQNKTQVVWPHNKQYQHSAIHRVHLDWLSCLRCVQDIVIGRHRDTEDRISWLLSAGRFEAALALAEADSSLPRAVFDTVVQVCGATCDVPWLLGCGDDVASTGKHQLSVFLTFVCRCGRSCPCALAGVQRS